MYINKTTIHQEELNVLLVENDLKKIIVDHISNHSNFIVTNDTEIKIILNKTDNGTIGAFTEAIVTLVNKID